MSTLIIASRYLLGRKLRTFLTTLAIVFGVLVIFALNILGPTFLETFQANIMAASGQVDLTITHRTNEPFSISRLDEVREVAGVRTVAGSLNRPLNLPNDYVDENASQTDIYSVLSLVGVDVETAQILHTYPVTKGRFLEPADRDAAVISTSLADAFGVTIGDQFSLPTAIGETKLTVVGLLPARTLPGNEEVMVTLEEAQFLLDKPDQINTIEANLTEATDQTKRAAIQAAIEERIGEEFRIGALSSALETVRDRIALAGIAIGAIGGLSLLMGAFIIFNTFRTVVAERRHDIGMLRSLGAGRWAVVGLILTEGLLQGFAGTVVGMALGYLVASGGLYLFSGLVRQFIHITFRAPIISPPLVALTVLIGVGVTVLAGLLPALSASTVTPLQALRPSVEDAAERPRIGTGGKIGIGLIILAMAGLFTSNLTIASIGFLLLLVGLALVAPVLIIPLAGVFGGLLRLILAREGTGTIAEANLSRQPSRAAATASATMIGLALIVGMLSLVGSLKGSFTAALRDSLRSDYMLIPPAVAFWDSNVGANAGLADKVRDMDEVEALSTLRVTGTFTQGAPATVFGIDPVAFPKVSGLMFSEGDADEAYAALVDGRSAILNGVLAAQAKVKVGDNIQLTTLQGPRSYHVAAIATDYLNAKLPTAFISQANLTADFNKTEDVFIQFNLKPEANAADFEPKLRAITANYPQFRVVSGRVYFEENRQILENSFLGIDIMMVALAVPSLIALLNTLAIAVIERTREIGMLRATGATRGQVSRVVIAEAILLAAIGTAFGLSAGLYLGYVMVGAIAAVGYPIDYLFSTDGVLVASIVGLTFGALASILPARQAARLEIVRALQYE